MLKTHIWLPRISPQVNFPMKVFKIWHIWFLLEYAYIYIYLLVNLFWPTLSNWARNYRWNGVSNFLGEVFWKKVQTEYFYNIYSKFFCDIYNFDKYVNFDKKKSFKKYSLLKWYSISLIKNQSWQPLCGLNFA